MTNDMATLISTVGFPIVACGVMAYFCNTLVTKFNESINALNVSIVQLTDKVAHLEMAIAEHNSKYMEVAADED